MPEDKARRLETLNKVLLWVNVVAPVLFYVLYWASLWTTYEPSRTDIFSESLVWFSFYTALDIVIFSCQLVSAAFLFIALHKIRKFMVSQGFSDQLNVKSMTVHAVCFALYCLAVVAYLVSYSIWTF